MRARVVTVLVIVAVIGGVFAETADAYLYRKSRNGIFEVFADVRICRDGIEFVLGEEQDDPVSFAGARVLLFDDRGQLRLDYRGTALPAISDPERIVPDWEANIIGDFDTPHLVRTTQPWAGGRLRPGTQLTAQLPQLPGQGGTITFPLADEPPLVVERCKVFKPVKADVDIRPGVSPNLIDPASSAPVPIVFFGGPAFDPRLLNVSTVRVGSAPPIAGAGADVDGDGDFDVVLTFSPAASGVACGARRVEVTATSIYGWPIRAREPIRTTC